MKTLMRLGTYGEKHDQLVKHLQQRQQQQNAQSQSKTDETLLESFGEKYGKLVEDSRDQDQEVETSTQTSPSDFPQDARQKRRHGDFDDKFLHGNPNSRGPSSPGSTPCKKCAHHHQCYNEKLHRARFTEGELQAQRFATMEHDERDRGRGQVPGEFGGIASSGLGGSSPRFLRGSRPCSSPSPSSPRHWKRTSSGRSSPSKRRLDDRWAGRNSPKSKKKRLEEKWNEQHLSLRFGDSPLTDCQVCRHHHGIREHLPPPPTQLELLRARMKKGDVWWALRSGGDPPSKFGCKRCLVHHLHNEKYIISINEEAALHKSEDAHGLKSRYTRRNQRYNKQSPRQSPRWSPASKSPRWSPSSRSPRWSPASRSPRWSPSISPPPGLSRPNSSYISPYRYRSSGPSKTFYNEGTTRFRSPSPPFSFSPRASKKMAYAKSEEALRRLIYDVLRESEGSPHSLPNFWENSPQRNARDETGDQYPRENFGLYAKDVMNKARKLTGQDFAYEDGTPSDRLLSQTNPKLRPVKNNYNQDEGFGGKRARKQNKIPASKPVRFDPVWNPRKDAAVGSRFGSPKWSKECLHTREVLKKVLHSPREAMTDITSGAGRGGSVRQPARLQVGVGAKSPAAKNRNPTNCACEEILMQMSKDRPEKDPGDKERAEAAPIVTEVRGRHPAPGRENLSPNKEIKSSSNNKYPETRLRRLRSNSSPNLAQKEVGLEREKSGAELKEVDGLQLKPPSSWKLNQSNKHRPCPEDNVGLTRSQDGQLQSRLESQHKSKDEPLRPGGAGKQPFRTVGCMKIGDILGNFLSSNLPSCTLPKPSVRLQDGSGEAGKCENECSLNSSKEQEHLGGKLQLLNIEQNVETEEKVCLTLPDVEKGHGKKATSESGFEHELTHPPFPVSLVQGSSALTPLKSIRDQNTGKSPNKSSRSPRQGKPSNKTSSSPRQGNPLNKTSSSPRQGKPSNKTSSSPSQSRPSNKTSSSSSQCKPSNKSSRSPSQCRLSYKSSRPTSSGKSRIKAAESQSETSETETNLDEVPGTSTGAPCATNPKLCGKDLRIELEIIGNMTLDALDGRLKQFLKGIGGFIYYSNRDGGIPRIKELSTYFSGKKPLLWFFPRS